MYYYIHVVGLHVVGTAGHCMWLLGSNMYMY
jgi:hypothetical protein